MFDLSSVVNNGIGPDGVAAFAAMLRVNSGLRELKYVICAALL